MKELREAQLVGAEYLAAEHRQRGLARHVLTAGIDLLAKVGAERIKIVYEPDNPASGHLYRSVGFEPVKETDAFSGPTLQPVP